MTSDSTKAAACSVDGLLFDNWFDPIETALRERARNFIEELIHGELTAALDRPRYGRRGMKESPLGARWPSSWKPDAVSDGDLRDDRDHRAARPDRG